MNIIDWIVNLFANRKVKKVKRTFENDKQLQAMLDDYAQHTEKISKDVEEYCKKYGGC